MDPAIVVLKTERAEINAELAPPTFLEQNLLVFSPDDEVTVKGYETTRSGKTVFVTTEVTSKGRVVKLRNDDFAPIWTTTTTPTTEKAVVVTGKVKSFDRSDPAVVIVTTDRGDVRAELAPVAFLDQHKLVFAPNDVVTFTGYDVMRGDQKVFVVTDVTARERPIVKLRDVERRPLWTTVTTTTTETVDARDLTGTVTVVETTETPDGRLVTVKTDSGERVIALGPGPYLEKNRYVLRPGEKVVVRGWEVDRGGRRVFLSMNLRLGDRMFSFRRPDRTVIWEQ
jgi:hypothetical protein